MAVGIFDDTNIIIQGITGREGSFHAKLCKEYGSNVVAGVTPGKGGADVHGIPVYDSVSEACTEHCADMSLIFVPPVFAKEAILEAIYGGIRVIVCITEGIPVHDMIAVKNAVKNYNVKIIGPNSPGIISPGLAKAGIMPGHIFKKGEVGVMSRSGTLLYEAADQIVSSGLGVSTAVGIGGDPVIGTDYLYWIKRFEADPSTSAILIIGEIGGDAEETVAEYIKDNVSKPVFAFIAGRSAPEGKRMGHAGAIILGEKGTVRSKETAFEKAGVCVIKNLARIGSAMSEDLL